jgi:RimJ/RimL family protein N-acetyltransferase
MGQGHASEAARHMVGWAFEALQPPLICAVCDPENTASSAVMLKLGMRPVGVGRWYDADCARYDLTADDWAASPLSHQARAEALAAREAEA